MQKRLLQTPILLDCTGMSPTTDMPQAAMRQRNWMPWIAFLLALAAMLSNAGFFIALPGQRAIAWLSIALSITALVCAAVGIMRAFRQPQVYGGKVSSSILGVVALLICGLVGFGSIHARDLPSSAAAPQIGQKVPDFTLADTSGNRVSLGELLGNAGPPAFANNTTGQAAPVGMSTTAPIKAVLLVFYRGYW
jgi:hypothetical protein